MSAPLFRTAIPLASRTAAQAVKRQQPFSIMSKLRHFGRAIEPHPFERLPVTQRAQAADWSKDVRQLGGQALV